ncbi:MAG: acyl-CoA dehydrogenase family protein [Anaerolineaceae bacterium]
MTTQPQAVVAQESALRRARALADRFALTAAEVDRTAAFPFANFEALRDTGLLNLTVPTRLGGTGAGLETACRVVSTIGGGEPSTALVYAMHLIYHALPALNGVWTPSVHEMLCRESLAGIALINVMRVEPELGTPTRGGLPSMTAVRTASGWRVSGHKMYATGSPLLRYFICWSRTAGDDPQVGWFVVPRDAPGLRIVETWDHMGMRATGSHDLILENVEIPAEYAVDIRAPGAWLPPDPVQSSWNNLVLAALYHGIARAAATWLRGYLHDRVPANLGTSLATLPRFQSSIGEIEGLLWENERLIFGLAAELDVGGYDPRVASQTGFAKFAATNNAVKAVDIAMSLIGNPGLSRSNPLERYHRDVLCSRIHMPQDDMVTLNAGKAALGIQP